MKSNYRRIGDYIKPVSNRNVNDIPLPLKGINIDKFFMPSVANVVGTDLSKYKIVKSGQFACNRMHVGRDKRLPVALLEGTEDIIVSPAYDVFEIKNEKELLPEYLMMWFSRKEFDRKAWFHTDGDVRGGLPWESFKSIDVPVPSIEKQKEIVKEYEAIVNRIKLNEEINKKLEETAQAIYKQWFVEFEFPDENGNPYKSSGGEMVWNEELEKEIPLGWEISNIGIISNVIDCLHSKKPDQLFEDNGHMLLQIQNIGDYGLLDITSKYFISEFDYNLWTSRIEISEGDCILTNVGVDAIAQIPKGIKAALGRNMTGIRLKNDFKYPAFFITLLLSNSMKNEIENNKDTGTIMQALNVSSIPKLRFVKGTSLILEGFESIARSARLEMEILFNEKQRLSELKDSLLSKLATVEG